VPQLPQLVRLVRVSTQLAPHCVRPLSQLPLQAPAEQTWPKAQAVPQVPQFNGSEVASVQPVAQDVRPGRHWQLPLAQACPLAHVTPQLPQ
jgi:hypothetical protein